MLPVYMSVFCQLFDLIHVKQTVQYVHMSDSVHIKYLHLYCMLYVHWRSCKKRWVVGGWMVVGHCVACIFPCSSIFLSLPSPLTLCLRISVMICFLHAWLSAAHLRINSSPYRWKEMPASGLHSVKPTLPHIFKVCVLNSPLVQCC